jgi:hypothetical protein
MQIRKEKKMDNDNNMKDNKVYDLHFVKGYVWYAYPLKNDNEFDPALLNPPTGAKCTFNIKDFVSRVRYSNYREDGLLLLTNKPSKPEVPAGWEIVPLNVPEGFGGKISREGDTTLVLRHIHTLETTSDYAFSVFAILELEESQE